MKQSNLRRILSAVLVVAMFLGMLPIIGVSAAGSFVPPDGRFVISETQYTITKGVTETQLILNDATGANQVYGYMTTVAPGASVKLKASYSGYYAANSTPESRAEAAKNLKWDMTSTTKQAAAYEKATGETVVAATNADYYNMQTGQCLGYLIMEGNVVQTSNGSSQEPYFAVLKDGSYAIRDYGTPTDDVVEAISGPFFLLRNGEYALGADAALAPRNSIGLKADGTLVMFLVDGRAGISAGMTCYEVASALKAQGVVDAIYLDGGGSATLASRHEGSDALTIQNHPSDGPERVVASTLLLVATEDATGKFDHAALTPKNELYIVGTDIQFMANGVDVGGFAAEIPADAAWKLTDDALGTIDSTGLFHSNGKPGEVTVQLTVGDKVVGETSVQLAEPEELYFASDALNLAFNKTSDLGLVVRAANRAMNTGTVSFQWKLESLTEGVSAEQIAAFEGNLLRTKKLNQSVNATVTVSFTKADGSVLTDTIALEIGKMPQVFWDFEDDATGVLPEYDWGKAVNGGYDPGKPVTYFGWDDEAGEPGMVTREGPFLFDGNYLEDKNDVCRYPASNIFGALGYKYYTNHTSYMINHAAGGAIVDAENGEVRFGEHALRWDYNYSELNPGYKNVNMWLYPAGGTYYNDVENCIAFEGTPTGLGFWVYAPEGTPNFWLWLQISYTNEYGKTVRPYIHLTTQEGRNMQYSGIYWDGWMYVEADLTPYAKYVTPETPLYLANGTSFLSLTFIPGGSANENGDKIPMGDFAKGSLYFDNFRVVYGDTVDDMDNPVIDSVTAGGKTLSEETVTLDDTNVKLVATFHDPEGENATDIDTAKTAIYVDGRKQILTVSSATKAEAAANLSNGIHAVTVSVTDGFGNNTKQTYYIEVADEDASVGSVILQVPETAELGGTCELVLRAGNAARISSMDVQLALTEVFGTPVVTFENGFGGTASYENGILTIHAEATKAPADVDIVRITLQLAPATARGTVLDVSVKSGSFVDNGTAYTFSGLPATVGVTAAYDLTTDIMVADANGKVYVTKADGTPAAGVKVYKLDGSDEILLGTTNTSGVVVTNKLCQNVGETWTVYAHGTDGYSFRVSGTTSGIGSDDVLPFNVRLNAVKDSATTASVTWFSAPQYTNQKAVLQYAKSGQELTTVVGTSALRSFTEDNQAALLNSVTLTGLEPGTTYTYRVGDGVEGHWSEERTFTTSTTGENTSFFVLGDTQLSGNDETDAPFIATMDTIAEAVNKTEAAFGIQTGDFVDSANNLKRWNQILGLFGTEYAELPVVQVLGNHEYYADVTASKASAIFNLPSKDFYSVEYGNVYVAVINCNANLEAAAAWLAEDAAESDCTWKVLTVHQPPYYTNPKGSSAPYNALLPAAAEEAGIDFVFSGHDHAYARTEPIANGAVDEENGVVYFVCGDLGEKSRGTEYAPENNPDFHFATISQDYDAVYLIANATDRAMTVTAYHLDGSVLDTYTKELPEEPAHDHVCVYDRTADEVRCTVDGCPAPVVENYTGFAVDSETGKQMYFLNGKYVTDWFSIGSELYHFDETTGLEHKVTVVEDVPTDCYAAGHKTVKCECGATKTVEYEKPAGHINKAHTNEDGETYYVCVTCGRISAYDLAFIDVEDTDWFAGAVDYAVRNDLFKGRAVNIFAPNEHMTRAELVTVLWRVAGSPDFDNVHTTAFEDCAKNAWYIAAVNWAAKNGIVNGVTETRFNPNGKITREQIVAILYRYAKFAELDTSKTATLDAFTDADKVSEYAVDAMRWAVGTGIIQGDGNMIKPANNATRAQVATIMMRFVEMYKTEE